MLIAEAGLIKGERIGVDASTMEANAALRNIVRRDNGEGYREMLECLARESGVETPTAENLARLDRKRKGKKLSNTDWVSKSDPEAKIAKMKDGTTHLAYKPEHAVDLDTGAVVAAELHPADEGDTTTLSKTLAKAEANLEAVDAAPTSEDPAECVADKGYHSRAVLRALNDSPWKTRIAAPKQTGFSRWHGDEAARRAVTNNRARLKSDAHRNVDAVALAGEGGKVGRNHDRGDVVGLDVAAAGVDPQALQHGLEALAGEDRVGQGIAGAVEADHQSVADEKVVANPFETRNVLDSRARRGGRRDGQPETRCSAPGSLDTSLSHAAGLIEIAACHA